MLKEAFTDQNMVQIRKVAVIGAGNIGGAIAAGMAAGGSVSPADIIVTARTSRSLDRVRAICQEITGHTDNRLAVEGADLVVLAVKPWQADRLVNASEVRAALQGRRDWALATLMTVLKRLCDKGFLRCEKAGRNNLYRALIREEAYQQQEGRTVLEKLYGNSVTGLVASLYAGKTIDDRDMAELKRFLEEWEGGK